MARYSTEFIQRVKNSTDLLELASEYTEMKKSGRIIYQGLCPHPKHKEDTASFTVYTNNNTWKCFGCSPNKGEKGYYSNDCIGFLSWVTEGKMSFQDIIKHLAKRAGIPLPNDKHQREYDTNRKKMLMYERSLTNEAYDYLHSRGLTNESIAKWHIGYDKYNDRIVFPLFNRYGDIVGFNNRLLSDPKDKKEKKYIHSANNEIFQKSNYLYGMHDINKDLDYIIITEGVMDTILAKQYGLENVVCTLGTSLSDYNIEQIKKLNMRPILAYDCDGPTNDATKGAGERATERVNNLFIEHNIYCKILPLPEGSDLADIANEKRNNLKDYVYANCIPYSFMKIKDVINQYTQRLFELKMDFQPQIKAILKGSTMEERGFIESFLFDELRIRIEDCEDDFMQQMYQEEDM